MISVYCDLLPDVPYVPFLYPNLGVQEQDSLLYMNRAFADMGDPCVNVGDTPEEADYILLPHNYPRLKNHGAYIERQSGLAGRLGKKLIVFWHGDSSAQVPQRNTIVFRTNQYRSKLRENEHMMPAYAEDLLGGSLDVRKKHGGKPVIGFCGWADYKNLKNRIGTSLKNSVLTLGTMMGISDLQARKKGITFRMNALRHLQDSDIVEPNFIIRSSYSGNAKTLKTDPEQTRQEYVDNMLQSDYALAIKGDGNYSYRFYEALSLGRIPVLLDTDCALPLADTIDYKAFTVRVPYWDVYAIDHYVKAHYESVTDEEFQEAQRKAREAFEQYLSPSSFLRYIAQNVL